MASANLATADAKCGDDEDGQGHPAGVALVDRIVVLLKTEHPEDSVLLAQVEQAAIDAITP